MERQGKMEMVAKEREMQRLQCIPKKWNRREEYEFLRVLTGYGIDLLPPSVLAPGTSLVPDWTKFKQMAHLERKSDETLSDYYKVFITMCKRQAGVKLGENEKGFEGIIEDISEDHAKLILDRLELLSKLREIAKHPQLEERLKLCMVNADTPDWWEPGKHDKELLAAVLKHGLYRSETFIFNDHSFSFADSEKRFIRELEAQIQRSIKLEAMNAEKQSAAAAATSSIKDEIIDLDEELLTKSSLIKKENYSPVKTEIKKESNKVKKEDCKKESPEAADEKDDNYQDLSTKKNIKEDIECQDLTKDDDDDEPISLEKDKGKPQDTGEKENKDSETMETDEGPKKTLSKDDKDTAAIDLVQEQDLSKPKKEPEETSEEKSCSGNVETKSETDEGDEKSVDNKKNLSTDVDKDELDLTKDKAIKEDKDKSGDSEETVEKTKEKVESDVTKKSTNEEEILDLATATSGSSDPDDEEVMKEKEKAVEEECNKQAAELKARFPDLEVIQPGAAKQKLEKPKLEMCMIRWFKDFALERRVCHIVTCVETGKWPVDKEYSALAGCKGIELNIGLHEAIPHLSVAVEKRSTTPDVITITTDQGVTKHLPTSQVQQQAAAAAAVTTAPTPAPAPIPLAPVSTSSITTPKMSTPTTPSVPSVSAAAAAAAAAAGLTGLDANSLNAAMAAAVAAAGGNASALSALLPGMSLTALSGLTIPNANNNSPSGPATNTTSTNSGKKRKRHIAIDVETERAKLHALLNSSQSCKYFFYSYILTLSQVHPISFRLLLLYW